LCEIFPQADLFTLLHVKGSVSPIIESMNIKCSIIQRFPFSATRYRSYLPFFPMAIESFDLKKYDLIVSSSHCVAKGVIPAPGATHVAYVHSPMRYVWDMFPDYIGRNRGFLKGTLASGLSNYLRIWDVTSSARVDSFIANSRHVANRIRKYYRRDATIIHPPVDGNRFRVGSPEGFYLVVSALAPYKRVDLAIEAFNRLDYPLVIIGTGQDEKKLKTMAGHRIRFLGWQPDSIVADHYARCRAFIFPGEEDFGITPLEAQASGRPVIAYGRGGALETVLPLDPLNQADRLAEGTTKWTGLFFSTPTVDGLIDAVRLFEKNSESFDPEFARQQALKWDRHVFKKRISDAITKILEASL
jgi:glycosyltransferase involved in cell wall biosynthesis